MAFGIADLATVAIVRKRLLFLSQHPEHVEFILANFCRYDELAELVGREYIRDAVDLITNNAIEVAAFYEADLKHRPALAVVASGSEDQQYIGEYGTDCSTGTINPYVYASFEVNDIDETRTELTVAKGYGLAELLWAGLWVVNGTITRQIRGIIPGETHDRILLLESLPEEVSLKDWKAQSSEICKGYTVSESTDKVQILCKLQTTGDYSVHRLLTMVIRYCLKSARLEFDRFGIQNVFISYTPPTPTEPTEMEFETVFTINAISKESWIEKEYTTPTDIIDQTIAVPSTDPDEEGESAVYL